MTVPILAIAAVAAAASAHAQTTAAPSLDIPVIVTSGDATTKAAPDRAWITIASESRARSPREAQKLNATAMSNVMQQLEKAGLPADAIRTTSIDLHPEFDYEDGKQRLRGYVARNAIEVRVDTLSRLGEILDLAVGSGATSLGGVRFDLKDRAAAERAALKLAIADARGRAEAAAEAAGLRIDRIVRLEEHRGSTIPPPRPMMMRAEIAQQSETPVAPGEIEIRAAVTLTVAVK